MAIRKVIADMAGSVMEVVVAVGDEVAIDDTLVILESMKMELPMVSPWAGTVRAIHLAKGDLVTDGQAIVDLEA